jgi:hypothetical protein
MTTERFAKLYYSISYHNVNLPYVTIYYESILFWGRWCLVCCDDYEVLLGGQVEIGHTEYKILVS